MGKPRYLMDTVRNQWDDMEPEGFDIVQAMTVLKNLAPIVKDKIESGDDYTIELVTILSIIENQEIPEIIDFFPPESFIVNA